MRTPRYTTEAQYVQHTTYRAFPYRKVATLWGKGKTIAQIANAIGRVDKNNPKDPYHSLRNFLWRMHKGCYDEHGNWVKLPYRVSKRRVQAGRAAGLRAGGRH